MKKKVLSFILSGALLIGSAPVTIYADNTDGIEQTAEDGLVITDEEGHELESPFYLDVGDSEQLALENGEGKVENVKWSVQFPNILEVSESGEITAKASGDTMVYAEDEQGNKVSLRVSTGVAVEEINFPDKITIGLTELDSAGYLYLYDTSLLRYDFSIKPDYQDGMANWNEIKFTSDNQDVIRTSGAALYTEDYGTANLTLTITAKSGTTVTKNIQVEVKNIVTDIFIDPFPEALEVGETKTLSVQYSPDGADLSDVKFESSNPEILEVDNTGKITAKKGGVATITVSSGVVKESIEIEVREKVNSFSLSKNDISLTEGEREEINVTYTPDIPEIDKERLEVTSNNPDIVDANTYYPYDEITIDAIQAGDAEIIVKYADLPEQKINVHVEKYIPELDHFDAIPENSVLYIGDTTEVEIANIYPSDAEVDKSKIKWEARNPGIATIDENGKITAVGIGNAFFNVYYDGREVDTFDVKVVDQNEEKITLNIDGIHEGNKLYVGAEYDMYVESLFPYKEIKVKSSDESIIKVSDVLHPGNRFTISPKKVGKTTLTATVDGEPKTIEIEVIELNEITLENRAVPGADSAETLYVGKPALFIIRADGEEIPDYTYTATSSDTSVIGVKMAGRYGMDVTPKKTGTATITITCNEDPGKKLVINSTVKEYIPIEKLDFDQELVYMNVGDTFTQTVNVTPSNGTIWGQATYGSNAEYIATVDEKTGEVTAKAPGTVQIMYWVPEADQAATYTVVVRDKDNDSEGGSGGGDTIIISPSDDPTIDLSKNGLNLKVGESAELTATVKNSSKPVKWESSNPDCVEVADGKITALDKGIAVVTAKSGTAVGFCLVVVEGDELNGWQQDKVSKKWYYLKNGKAQTGWIKEDGEYYYCDPENSGAMAENKWISIEEPDPYNDNKVGDVWYRVDEDGKMQTGWISDPEVPWKIYLLDTNGRMMHSNWVNAPENQELNRPAGMYYLTDDGAVQMNGWTLAKGSDSVWWFCNPGTGLFEKDNPNSWAGKKLW